MNIPKVIQKAASWYLKNFPGAKVIYLGNYEGSEAFRVEMPEDSVTGYPPVFLLNKSTVTKLSGPKCLKVISSLS